MRVDIGWEHELARLVSARKAQEMSQLDLATVLDCSPAGLHAWETGKRQPRITTWLRWRTALGLGIPWGTQDHPAHKAWRDGVNKRRTK